MADEKLAAVLQLRHNDGFQEIFQKRHTIESKSNKKEIFNIF